MTIDDLEARAHTLGCTLEVSTYPMARFMDPSREPLYQHVVALEHGDGTSATVTGPIGGSVEQAFAAAAAAMERLREYQPTTTPPNVAYSAF